MTDEQIDAAAKAICRTYFGDVVTHGDARCCQLGGMDGCCLEAMKPVAVAALEALAQLSSHKDGA